MPTNDDRTLREQYADLLPEGGEPELELVVEGLDARYRRPAGLPESLHEPPPFLRPLMTAGARSRRTRALFSAPVLILAAVIICAGLVVAAGNILNLGRQTSTLPFNANFPLSGFHRIPTSVGSAKHPELLFIGTLDPSDMYSAMERWPLVKALEQFGTLSKVTAIDTKSDMHMMGLSIPTFDLSHAVYHSRYVLFVHRDLIGTDGKPFQKLSKSELDLYNHYARIAPSPLKGDRYSALNTVFSSLGQDHGRGLPLVAVGRYLQTNTQAMTFGTFEIFPTPPPTAVTVASPPTVIPFPTVEAALATGKDPPSGQIVEGVNGEANVIIALICHADGGKPKSVCGRSVIKKIGKHIR